MRISINGSALNSCWLFGRSVSLKSLRSLGPGQFGAEVPECWTKAKHCRAGFHILESLNSSSDLSKDEGDRKTGVAGAEN